MHCAAGITVDFFIPSMDRKPPLPGAYVGLSCQVCSVRLVADSYCFAGLPNFSTVANMRRTVSTRTDHGTIGPVGLGARLTLQICCKPFHYSREFRPETVLDSFS